MISGNTEWIIHRVVKSELLKQQEDVLRKIL
jgi:hypothetical protein